MDGSQLIEAVEEAFAVTGAETPPWLDPHPGDTAPLDEEYSRVTDAQRYRILGARARAWVEALTGLGLADVDEVTGRAVWESAPPVAPDRVIRLRPRRSGALTLLLGLGSFHGMAEAAASIGVGEPAMLLTLLPECGCDACDSGSDDLLEELDRYVRAAVSGDLVHVTTGDRIVISTGDCWSAQGRFRGTAAVDRLLDDARAGTSPHGVLHGAPWHHPPEVR